MPSLRPIHPVTSPLLQNAPKQWIHLNIIWWSKKDQKLLKLNLYLALFCTSKFHGRFDIEFNSKGSFPTSWSHEVRSISYKPYIWYFLYIASQNSSCPIIKCWPTLVSYLLADMWETRHHSEGKIKGTTWSDHHIFSFAIQNGFLCYVLLYITSSLTPSLVCKHGPKENKLFTDKKALVNKQVTCGQLTWLEETRSSDQLPLHLRNRSFIYLWNQLQVSFQVITYLLQNISFASAQTLWHPSLWWWGTKYWLQENAPWMWQLLWHWCILGKMQAWAEVWWTRITGCTKALTSTKKRKKRKSSLQ